MQRFNGKVVLVTGAAAGIGQGIAARFDAEGATVIGTDIDETGLAKVTEQLSDRFVSRVSDAGDVAAIADLASWIEQEHGRLDVLVNNAGIAMFANPEEVDYEKYSVQMAVLLNGPVFLVKHLAGLLRQSENGSVINISSASALLSMLNYCPYGLAKSAIAKLTEDCVISVPGVRHNTIMPGFVDTAIITNAYGDEKVAEITEMLKGLCPVPRIGSPEDIANAAAFLASDEAAYVNGANIVVDGGLSRLNALVAAELSQQ